MAMNKFMHPRNIYKNQPDFSELAEKYWNFGAITQMDVNGKVKINYKDENTLRELTKCLLQRDFGLNILLPTNRLIPTLPLRLNYILWIEDLLQVANVNGDVIGIDIGCGASCIYPLLGAKKNYWKLYALEGNEESYITAKENVEKNNLTEYINVHFVNTNSQLFSVINGNAHFCMCNPPFYASVEEINSKNAQNRTGKRLPPNNAPSGSEDELVCAGGEVEFIKNIIRESLHERNRIKIYTTMIGHKKNFTTICSLLSNESILNFTYTEFCQGHTTRWGVAWSFDTHLYLRLTPSCGPTGHNKSSVYTIPFATDVRKAFRDIEWILGQINLYFTEIEFQQNDNVVRAKIHADTNTWANQRRKRREQQRIQLATNSSGQSEIDSVEMDIEDSSIINNIKRKSESPVDIMHSMAKHAKCEENIEFNSMENPYLILLVTVRKVTNLIVLEFQYLNGVAKIDGVYQLFQYVQNFFKTKRLV